MPSFGLMIANLAHWRCNQVALRQQLGSIWLESLNTRLAPGGNPALLDALDAELHAFSSSFTRIHVLQALQVPYPMF